MAQQRAAGRGWGKADTTRCRFLTFLPLLGLMSLSVLAGCAPTRDMDAPARRLDAVRADKVKLEAFLRPFPKGADLHNHLSGAIYAESFIKWAIADGLCIDRRRLALAKPPCRNGLVPAAAAQDDRNLYDALVTSFSMHDFYPDDETAHDHFFATFDKFAAAEGEREGDMLAEALQRAASDHVVYLELMWSPGMPEARKLGKKIGWDRDFARLYRKLLAAGIDKIVAEVREDMNRREARAQDLLHCADPKLRQPGCDVAVRYLAQIIRVFPPSQVFAQDVFAFHLVKADPRFVGLNIVGPEDDPISLHDYSLHMRMFSYLHGLDPDVAMSLHAGELVEGKRGGLRRVKPEDLRFHIREAVDSAGARRIGHGVDIMREDDWKQLMAEMAARKVLVEINLTSNAQILGVSGDSHPFMSYWEAGVPVALSTDDEGVERTDLTHEYVRAVQDYHLSFKQLVTLSRNALSYGFVPGTNLWADPARFTHVAACASEKLGDDHPAAECGNFLTGSEKARLQWRLEGEFARFETAASP
ncbi:MAG: adenosine deaminase family protein [Stellaceae bacterium]